MRWKAHLAAAAVLLSAACLYWLPPSQCGFYPRCPVFELTHFQCPGCGMTRALAALFHGQFLLSWHYNPLALLLLPWFAVYFAVIYWRVLRHGEWIAPRLPQPILTVSLALIALFGVVRNLNIVLR